MSALKGLKQIQTIMFQQTDTSGAIIIIDAKYSNVFAECQLKDPYFVTYLTIMTTI